MLCLDPQLPVLAAPRAMAIVPVGDAVPAAGILLCLKGFGPGGVERIALRLADGWRRSGLPVALLVGQASGPMHAMAGELDAIRVPRWPLIGDRAPLLRIAVAALGSIRRRPPAIVFCPGNAYTIVAIVLKLLLGSACPPILAKVSNDLHRTDMTPMLRPLYRLWLRLQGRMIDHVAALSEPMAREVVALMHMPPHRVHVVPNPVLTLAECEADLLRSPYPSKGHPRKDRPREGRRFVAVGRLERQKDYPAMLRAFATARRPGDILTIYGEGRARKALEHLASTLAIAEQVEFAGHCANVRARLADHDILLLTSAYEGQPGSVVEALSMGLWVVATRCCAGMADLLDDGALGHLVDRGDGDGLVRAITLASPAMQDQPRARSKARTFTIEAAVTAYTALFAAVLAQRAGAMPQGLLPQTGPRWARMGSL